MHGDFFLVGDAAFLEGKMHGIFEREMRHVQRGKCMDFWRGKDWSCLKLFSISAWLLATTPAKNLQLAGWHRPLDLNFGHLHGILAQENKIFYIPYNVISSYEYEKVPLCDLEGANITYSIGMCI